VKGISVFFYNFFFKSRSNLIIKLFVLALLSVAGAITAAQEDASWHDKALELDKYPFSNIFIDSLKTNYNITPQLASLRSIPLKVSCVAETLAYEVTWGPFNAGHLILSSEPDVKNQTVRLGAKAISSSIISKIYKMRDYIISVVDANGMYPLFYEQHIREGKKYKSDRWILYDHSLGKAYAQEKVFKTFEAPPFTHDLLSILYHVRNLQSTPGDTFSLNLYIDKKVRRISFNCKSKTLVRINETNYDCTVLEPRISEDGKSFSKKDKIELYLSADRFSVPVLIKSKLKFGTIVVKLIYQSSNKHSYNDSTKK
jgi:hypothetical protein